MTQDIVKTGVDELLELLEHSPKISLTDAAAKLELDTGVIQAWVDFLVEEGIVGIEYKFTTPYIYLNKTIEKKKDLSKEETYNIQYFKRAFWEKARRNNIPDGQIDMLWKNHVIQALELQKKYFFFEAQRRRLQNIDILWEEYKEMINFA